MYRDPQIRSYEQQPPLIPGSRFRFEWPDYDDPDVYRIRTEVQEGAPGLYVLRSPDRNMKAIVEAYYPEGIRHSFYENELDPYRRADYQDGNLVVVHVWRVITREIDNRILDEIRRNNRSARSDLKRSASAHDRLLEMRNRREEEETASVEVREFLDMYTDAALETRKAMRIRNTSTRRIA